MQGDALRKRKHGNAGGADGGRFRHFCFARVEVSLVTSRSKSSAVLWAWDRSRLRGPALTALMRVCELDAVGLFLTWACMWPVPAAGDCGQLSEGRRIQ